MKNILTFLSTILLLSLLNSPASADELTPRDVPFEHKVSYTLEDYGAPDDVWVVFEFDEEHWICYDGWAEADAASIEDGRQSLSGAAMGLPHVNDGMPTQFYQVGFLMNPEDPTESFFTEWFAMTPKGVCIVQFAVDSRLRPELKDMFPASTPEPEGEDI